MKKLFLIFGFLLLLSSPAFARTCTWDGGGGDNLASTAANWDTDTTCVAADVVVFNATSSKNCTFDLTAAFTSINTTSYTGTVTASVTMTFTGGVTFANSTFAHGNQLFKLTGNQTISVGTTGNTFYDLTADANNITITLSSNITVEHDINFQAYSGNSQWQTDGSTRKVYVARNLTATSPYRNIATGNEVTIEVNGTGSQTWSGEYGSGGTGYENSWSFNIIINKSSGTLTMVGDATNHIFYQGGVTSFTYTAGTVDWSTNTVTYRPTSSNTISTGSGMHFYKVSLPASNTYTLSTDVYVDNTFTTLTDGQPTINGSSYKLMLAGNVDFASQYRVLGDATIEFTGSSSQTFTSIAGSAGGAYAGGIEINMIVNKSGGTLTFSGGNTFRFGGSKTLTYTAGTVDAGTSVLAPNGTCTLNTNGITWYDVTFGQGYTFTLTSNMAVSRNLSLVSSVTTNTYSGSGSIRKITVGGNVTATSGRAVGSSSTSNVNIELNGTGAQTYTGNTSYVNVPGILIFNKASGTATISGGLVPYAGITHTTGTVDFTTNTVTTAVTDNAITNVITSNGSITFYNFSLGNSKTVTLNDNLTISNDLDLGIAGVGTSTINGSTIMLSGNLKNTDGNQVTGTANLTFTGTGSQTWSSANTTYIILSGGTMTIDKTGGSLTVSGAVRWDGHFTYTQGTVVTTSSTVRFVGSKNVNSGSIVWNVFQTYSSGTITLTGNLNTADLTIDSGTTLSAGSNTITLTGNFAKTGTFTKGTSTVVFNGTTTCSVNGIDFYGMTINNGKTVHLTSTKTYSVSGSFLSSGTSTLDATTGGSRALLNITGSQSVTGITATDIDSSGGSTVHNIGGTNSNTVNWDTTAASLVAGNFLMLF